VIVRVRASLLQFFPGDSECGATNYASFYVALTNYGGGGIKLYVDYGTINLLNGFYIGDGQSYNQTFNLPAPPGDAIQATVTNQNYIHTATIKGEIGVTMPDTL
jgi:hypothetical protein